MGKRQTRIFQHQIKEKSALLTDQEANITLQNQTTFHGIILEVTDENLKLQDMRLKKHILLLKDITEVIIDKTTNW